MPPKKPRKSATGSSKASGESGESINEKLTSHTRSETKKLVKEYKAKLLKKGAPDIHDKTPNYTIAAMMVIDGELDAYDAQIFYPKSSKELTKLGFTEEHEEEDLRKIYDELIYKYQQYAEHTLGLSEASVKKSELSPLNILSLMRQNNVISDKEGDMLAEFMKKEFGHKFAKPFKIHNGPSKEESSKEEEKKEPRKEPSLKKFAQKFLAHKETQIKLAAKPDIEKTVKRAVQRRAIAPLLGKFSEHGRITTEERKERKKKREESAQKFPPTQQEYEQYQEYLKEKEELQKQKLKEGGAKLAEKVERGKGKLGQIAKAKLRFTRRGRHPIKSEELATPEKFNVVNTHIMKDIEKITHLRDYERARMDPETAKQVGDLNIRAFENTYGVKLQPSEQGFSPSEFFQKHLRHVYVDPKDPSKTKQHYRYVGSGMSTGFGLYEAVYLGLEPINQIDAAAKAHDIAYAVAGVQKYKLEQMKSKGAPYAELKEQTALVNSMVYDADTVFLKTVDKYKDTPEYENVAAQINVAIALKQVAEKTRLFDFAPAMKPITPKEAQENYEHMHEDLENIQKFHPFDHKTKDIIDVEEDIDALSKGHAGAIEAGEEKKGEENETHSHFDINSPNYHQRMQENVQFMHQQHATKYPDEIKEAPSKQVPLGEQISSASGQDIGIQGAVEEIQKNIQFNKPLPNNLLEQPITGERILSQHINIGDNADVVRLTEDERRKNLKFFTKYMWVPPTNANQQLMPFEISNKSNNSLVEKENAEIMMSLGKDTYTGEIKLQHRIVPNKQQLKKQKIVFFNDTPGSLQGEQHFFLNGPQRANPGKIVFARADGDGNDFMSPKEKINNIHQRLFRPIIFNQGRV